MLADLCYVLRSLTRSPGFSLVTIGTLALGLGAAGAMWSASRWVLAEGSRLPPDVYVVGAADQHGQFTGYRFGSDVEAIRSLDALFSAQALATMVSGNIERHGEIIDVMHVAASPEFLPMLEITPVLGRAFRADEAVAGKNDVVILSDYLWRTHFGARPDVLGETLTVDGAVCTVIGVLPRDVQMPATINAGLFRPLVFRLDPARPWDPMYQVFGKLRDGVSISSAEAAVAKATLATSAGVAANGSEWKAALRTLRQLQDPAQRRYTWIRLAAVGFLYAIACLNAANLMTLRTLQRGRELSIRLALGSSVAGVGRLILLEAAVLSTAGALGGALLANWLIPLLGSFAWVENKFSWADWSLDWRLVGVLALLGLASAIATAAIPLLQLRHRDLQTALKQGGARSGENRRLARLRGLFVVLQAAFAVILLTGAGLMTRTFDRLMAVPLGFNPDRLMTFQLSFPSTHQPPDYLAYVRTLRERLLPLPGVRDVAYASNMLLPGYYASWQPIETLDGKPLSVALDWLSPEIVATAGVRVLRGRLPDATAQNEVLINEALARAFSPNEDPIGRLIRIPKGPGVTAAPGATAAGWTVVGVIADLIEKPQAAPGFHVYVNGSAFPPALSVFYLRLAREADASFMSLVKKTVYAHDPRVVVLGEELAKNRQVAVTSSERYLALVLKLLSGIALLLTVVGLFAVIGYATTQRMPEYGVRLALGASRRDILLIVLRRGLWLAVIGVVAGLAGAAALVRTIQSLLYDTAAHDPVVFGSVAAVLLVASALACAIPGFRATRADVVRLLRAE